MVENMIKEGPFVAPLYPWAGVNWRKSGGNEIQAQNKCYKNYNSVTGTVENTWFKL